MKHDELLAQFDDEVDQRCALLRETADGMCSRLSATLDILLLGIPERVRSMPLSELLSDYGGDVKRAIRGQRADAGASSARAASPQTPVQRKQREPKAKLRTPMQSRKNP